MFENKKKRSTNYTPSEQSLLLAIVKDYTDIIENKSNGSATWRQKDETWDNVTMLFNMSTTCEPRTKLQLKNKYESIKKEAKKIKLSQGPRAPQSSVSFDFDGELAGPSAGGDNSSTRLSDTPSSCLEDSLPETVDPLFVTSSVPLSVPMDLDFTQRVRLPEIRPTKPPSIMRRNVETLAEEKRQLVRIQMQMAREKLMQNRKEHVMRMENMRLEKERLELERAEGRERLRHLKETETNKTSETNLRAENERSDLEELEGTQSREKLRHLKMETRERELKILLLENELRQKSINDSKVY